MVEREVNTCLPCQASTDKHQSDPLKPSTAPTEPWKKLHCRPTPDKNHLLVVVDALSRYPEVVVVNGTSAEDNICAFSDIFSRHGYPKHLPSDNGNVTHLIQEYIRKNIVEHVPNFSAEDPESNGSAEAFMKHVKKIILTATISNLDPYLEINKHMI